MGRINLRNAVGMLMENERMVKQYKLDIQCHAAPSLAFNDEGGEAIVGNLFLLGRENVLLVGAGEELQLCSLPSTALFFSR